MGYIQMIFIAFLLMFSGGVFADRPWTMDSGATITIDSWDPETKTFEVTYLEYPAQGPLITTPEHLAKAIKALNLERIKRDPKSIVETQFTTDKDMVLLLPEEVEARKPKAAKAPAPKAKEKGKNN